jgi:murein tripeptide amidase MpaA
LRNEHAIHHLLCCTWCFKLVEDYATDPLIKELRDRYDWFIMPVANPDGYVYTWQYVTPLSHPLFKFNLDLFVER